MPVHIVAGGQDGDEGKGKTAAYLALRDNPEIVLRVSAPQAGHTIEYKGKRIGLAALPSGFVNPNSRILIGRGAFIYVPKFLEELDTTGLYGKDGVERVGVDRHATIVRYNHKEEERASANLMSKVGSVGTGTGPARRDKIMRVSSLMFAEDVPALQPYLTDSVEEIHQALSQQKKILLECDQGAKLSLVHGPYPFVTSRDTTAPTFLGEAGIPPRETKEIYLVFKPYTTRVDREGPLENLVKDENTLKWCLEQGHEIGTVSGRIRRIGEFEWENAKRAIGLNGPTQLVFTHMDMFGQFNAVENMPEKAVEFLTKVKQELETTYPYPKTTLLSIGPKIEDIIDIKDF